MLINILIGILLLIGPIIILSAIYFLIRNEKVYKWRIAALNENLNLYKYLPTYDEMLYKYWWIWNANMFKKMAIEKVQNEQA